MALGFGRKKPAEDAPESPEVVAAPVAAHAPSSPQPDDFNAFDLDAFAVPTLNATTPTDAPQGAAMPQAAPADSGSAFDFPDGAPNATPGSTPTTLSATEPDAPDFDKLYEIEQANAAQQAAQNAARTSASAPLVPPTATAQESNTPFYEPQVPVEAEIEVQPKKKLPLVPILGALGALALAGGAASYFSSQNAPQTDESAPVVSAKVVSTKVARPAAETPTQIANSVGGNSVAGNSVGVVSTGTNPVNPGIPPASAQLAQMKALWKRGADAKHRGDFAGARRYWNQGLKIQPDNIGFQESIAKLPK